jgi:plastocyanin
MTRHAPLWAGLGLMVAGLAFVVAGLAVAPHAPGGAAAAGGPVTGRGPMMGGGPVTDSEAGPGSPGFVAGTVAAPRAVRVVATPALRFVPDTVAVLQGETITFEVTTMGPTVHEFMVGPAADVAADAPGTPEIADLSMMRSGSVTYTFDGPGPYAFACHATGHYEAGMSGTITIVP